MKIENMMENFLEDFINAVEAENELRNDQMIEQLKTNLLNNPYKLSNPDNYFAMFQFPLIDLLENATRVLHRKIDKQMKDKHKPQFIYLHYDYLSNNIEKLIQEKRKTNCCCADVSKTILEMYLEYSLTGTVPETDYEEHYWTPRFGENQDWMDFCDGLYHLYYGDNKQYLLVLKKLMEAEIRTYQHVIHKKIAIFKNGVQVVISKWWDSYNDPTEETDDCLLLSTRMIPFENNYEIVKSEDGIFNYYKVPKTDIEEIKEVEKTVMI